jgi:hypothetical protein
VPGDAVVAEGEYRGGGDGRRRTVVLSRPLPGRGQGEGEGVPSFGSTDSQRGLTSTRGEMAPSALRSSVVAGEPQPMCTTSRVDGARKSSACQSVRLIEQAESDEASETASGAGARPAKRGGGAAQASARAKACMLASNKSRCCNKFGGPSSGPLCYLHCSVQGTQICKITCRLCKLWPNRLVIRRHQNSITTRSEIRP